MNIRSCVIFGGTGCIGTHLADHLLRRSFIEHVYLADVQPLRDEPYTGNLRRHMHLNGSAATRAVYVPCDVRNPIENSNLPEETDLIVNLAAVHREPGHQPHEYYETNLPGAENVCAYATRANCGQIVFTSSIAPYGCSDAMRNEDSEPMPETPYGGSKLAAEKIHLAWQRAEPNRAVIILRPGVVFGAGEHANVARLARSVARGYFVYMGNRETRKAGIYAKELCSVIEFAVNVQQNSGGGSLLWNVSMDPPPTMEEYVRAICVAGGLKEPRYSVPRRLLIGASYPVAGIAGLFGIRQPVDPVRIRKFSQPTYIEPLRLREAGYRFHYTLEEAMVDWRNDAPEDFRA